MTRFWRMKGYSMMKVLFVNTADYVFGAEKSLIGILRFLPREIERHLICPFGSPIADAADEFGVKVHEWPFKRIMRWQFLRFAGCVRKVYRFLRKGEFDLIHANSFPAAVHTSIAAKLSGTPIISVVHDIAPFSQISRRLLKISDVIVAVSQSTAKNLIKLGVPENKIKVIYNGFDFSEWETIPNGRKPRPDGGELLYVGQIEPRKGIDILLSAFKLVLKSKPEATLSIIGEDMVEGGRLTNKYRKMAEELGISKSVAFKGYMMDVTPEYMNKDVFILPSRVEPFGRVLVEAMSAGLPVVASDVGGIPEIIPDEDKGVLVPVDNHQALAEAVLKVLDAGGRASMMAKNGRKYVMENFSMERQISSYMDLYRKTVKVSC